MSQSTQTPTNIEPTASDYQLMAAAYAVIRGVDIGLYESVDAAIATLYADGIDQLDYSTPWTPADHWRRVDHWIPSPDESAMTWDTYERQSPATGSPGSFLARFGTRAEWSVPIWYPFHLLRDCRYRPKTQKPA